MMGGWQWSLGVNVVILIIREGVVNMIVGIFGFRTMFLIF